MPSKPAPPNAARAVILLLRLLQAPLSRGLLVLRRLLGALGGVARRVGVSAGTGELALVDDQIFGADRLLGEIALQNLARAGRVPGLRRQRAPRDMRGHAVMGHGAPEMLPRRRLREPHVAGIASKLAAFERSHDRVAVADLAAGSVHEIGAALHLADQLVV